MVQQVNLCLPILRKQKPRFGAQSLLQALVVVLAVGGLFGAAWVWNLNQASDILRQTLAAQTQELAAMQAVLEKNQAGSVPALAAAQQVLAQRRKLLVQRQLALAALQQGRAEPGFGHAARLQLVAQTIASQAWVTQLRADDTLLEVSGYTLEPAVLTEWVNRLAQSPLLKGQALSTVMVERVTPTAVLPGGALDRQAVATKDVQPPVKGGADKAAKPLPRWSYTLLSSLAKPAADATAKP
jgi:Tfp pilus assembly protein PilN